MNEEELKRKVKEKYLGAIDLIIALAIIIVILGLMSGCALKPPEFKTPESRLSHLSEKPIPEIKIYPIKPYPKSYVISTSLNTYAGFDQKGMYDLLTFRAEHLANTQNLIALSEIYTLDINERNYLLLLAKDLEQKGFIYQEKAHNADFYLNRQRQLFNVRLWLERGFFSVVIAAILL